jgi:cell division protein FtsB
MNPDDQTNNSVQPGSTFQPADTSNQPPSQQAPEPSEINTKPTKNRKKIWLIFGVALALILLTSVLVAITAPNKPNQTQQNTQQNKPQGPQAATAIDVEQTNNSINQDLSSLDDGADFPANQLHDDALGL